MLYIVLECCLSFALMWGPRDPPWRDVASCRWSITATSEVDTGDTPPPVTYAPRPRLLHGFLFVAVCAESPDHVSGKERDVSSAYPELLGAVCGGDDSGRALLGQDRGERDIAVDLQRHGGERDTRTVQ